MAQSWLKTGIAAILAGCLMGLLACSESTLPPADSLTIGQAFPEINLTSLDGETIPFSEFRGKLVVLNVWATWCAPCRREMPNLQQLSDSLDPDRFSVIGLAQDDDEHIVREYLLDKAVTFPSYIDLNQRVARDELGIQIYPYTLVIAPDGKLIQRVVGPREWQRRDVIELLEQAFRGDYSGFSS